MRVNLAAVLMSVVVIGAGAAWTNSLNKNITKYKRKATGQGNVSDLKLTRNAAAIPMIATGMCVFCFSVSRA